MDVKKIQERLNEVGAYNLDVDGINGKHTQAAIKDFQSKNKLVVDGIVGVKTLAALFPAAPTTSVNEVHDQSLLKPIIADSLYTNTYAVEVACSEVGVKEATGKNDGYAVELFLASVGLPKGFAWCMAFVHWCFDITALHFNVPNPLARSGGVLYQWNKADSQHKILRAPKQGDIFIMDFGNGHGHTGFVINEGSTTINTVEGNTNDMGSANGDGVYYRVRNKSSVKGYIRTYLFD